MMRALKALSALVILAALFLPVATCHDLHGRKSGVYIANGSTEMAFFIWPVLFVAIELLVRKPRLVRVLVALEPILTVISAVVLWFGFAMAGVVTLGDAEPAVGTYTAAAGFAGYFCGSIVENFGSLRRRFNIIYLIGLCGNP